MDSMIFGMELYESLDFVLNYVYLDHGKDVYGLQT